MTKRAKLLNRFLSKPKDFTYDEVRKLLSGYGYTEKQGSGSRVAFINRDLRSIIHVHKPHPGKIMKGYQLGYIEDSLRALQLIE